MSRTDYAEIEIRKELRSYHFEDPRYNRLSHILGTETYKEKYGSRRDDLIFIAKHGTSICPVLYVHAPKHFKEK